MIIYQVTRQAWLKAATLNWTRLQCQGRRGRERLCFRVNFDTYMSFELRGQDSN